MNIKQIITVGLMAMETLAQTGPTIVSSQMRASDPTVMDSVYKVVCDKPTVNVRALAFEDGERSFWMVARPETFVFSPELCCP